MSSEPTLVQRVQSSYHQLSAVATVLNSVSDQLSKPVNEIDALLKKLNLGIVAWVTLREGAELPEHWSEELGYAKIGGKWGIAIRTVVGDYNYPDQDDIDEWLFNDAPRALRLSAVERLPELLDTLTRVAEDATAKIREKVGAVRTLADAVIEAERGGQHSAKVSVNIKVNPSTPEQKK